MVQTLKLIMISIMLVRCANNLAYYRFAIATVHSIARGDEDSHALLAFTILILLSLFAPVGYNQHPCRRIAAFGLYFLPFFIPERFMARYKWRAIIGLFLWNEFLVRPPAHETSYDGYLENRGGDRWAAWLEDNVMSAPA